jgi:DNA polymerase I-like protein with 3'-5' exonuclease and polymerase domains
VTGRLSSSSPNLQNVPNKGDAKIKQAYISRFGDAGLLMQADFSQIELRVAACYFDDADMIQAYLDDEDLHTLSGIAISDLSPEEYYALPKKDQKSWRTRAKRVNFGIIYGIGAPGLQGSLQGDGIFMSIEECQALMDKFFEVRPGLAAGIEALHDHVQKTGFIETFTGRKRRLPEVFSGDNKIIARALRQATNFPIQSAAGDMTLMSIVLLHRRMQKRGFQSKMILTVHDSIIFDCHVDEFLELSCMVKEVMENLPKYSDEALPGLDWDWLRVPIRSDCEIGPTWRSMVDFDPYKIGTTANTPLYDEDGKTIRDPVSVDELWEVMSTKAEKSVLW